ncbi:hypothetical protein C362_03077 [Cryptococcus neoformans Bt1]|nr:hypothetical protein C362_03077 [Cryptococcus neoformans var. grubii Bt1]
MFYQANIEQWRAEDNEDNDCGRTFQRRAVHFFQFVDSEIKKVYESGGWAALQAAQRAASDEDKLRFGGLVDRGGERRIPDTFNTLEDFQRRVVNTFREFWQQELSEGWRQPAAQQSGSPLGLPAFRGEFSSARGQREISPPRDSCAPTREHFVSWQIVKLIAPSALSESNGRHSSAIGGTSPPPDTAPFRDATPSTPTGPSPLQTQGSYSGRGGSRRGRRSSRGGRRGSAGRTPSTRPSRRRNASEMLAETSAGGETEREEERSSVRASTRLRR